MPAFYTRKRGRRSGSAHGPTTGLGIPRGRGVRLFADDPGMHRLVLASTRTFESGVV